MKLAQVPVSHFAIPDSQLDWREIQNVCSVMANLTPE
jgi:hypothetical protein